MRPLGHRSIKATICLWSALHPEARRDEVMTWRSREKCRFEVFGLILLSWGFWVDTVTNGVIFGLRVGKDFVEDTWWGWRTEEIAWSRKVLRRKPFDVPSWDLLALLWLFACSSELTFVFCGQSGEADIRTGCVEETGTFWCSREVYSVDWLICIWVRALRVPMNLALNLRVLRAPY